MFQTLCIVTALLETLVTIFTKTIHTWLLQTYNGSLIKAFEYFIRSITTFHLSLIFTDPILLKTIVIIIFFTYYECFFLSILVNKVFPHFDK